MMRRRLRARLDGFDQWSQGTAVTIEMGLCASQEEYERAFRTAWSQVPDGAVVFCFLHDISPTEYHDLVEGRLVQPQVMGVFLKPFGGEGRQKNQPCEHVD
jgi:hypothetical protein